MFPISDVSDLDHVLIPNNIPPGYAMCCFHGQSFELYDQPSPQNQHLAASPI
jgi:hypothetical protein